MHRTIPKTLGATAMLIALASPLTVMAQAGGPTACSIINAEELKQLTGLRDVLRRGPVAADPSELPKGITECEYLGLSFSLSTRMTREWFDRTRQDQIKQGTKVEPVSGLGDEAYYWWDPRPGTYRQVGIALRSGSYRLAIMDMASSDSIQAAKATVLKAAQHTAPKLR
jgi:hypothetical protein